MDFLKLTVYLVHVSFLLPIDELLLKTKTDTTHHFPHWFGTRQGNGKCIRKTYLYQHSCELTVTNSSVIL